MSPKTVGGFVAAAVAAVAVVGMVGGGLAPAQAAPNPRPTPRPTATASPDPTGAIARRRVDVDGDGRRDRVVVAEVEGGPRITVVTAKKKTASLDFTNEPALDEQRNISWRFAAELDGVRGAELVVHTGHSWMAERDLIFTWRKGHITTVARNDGIDRSGRTDTDNPTWWPRCASEDVKCGYRSTTVRGRRVAQTWEIKTVPGSRRYAATVRTSRWNGTGWNVAMTVKTTIPKTRAAVARIVGPAPRDLSTP